ncbi:unnamed protein product [Aureobasidium mustum]|uniref:Uncharacterized protein n=1 Tax=Aureobasidium mustum TaxID=2773714 RepID=A0A9N8PH77_9PEZI|nr:unnamed protein product [Aureobasidium mustum]
MSSPLERALLRLQVFSKGPSLGYLLKTHLTTQDMLNLRLTSRSLYDPAELNEVAFETIYIHTPVPHGRKQYTNTLRTIGFLCRQVVVKIAYPSKICCSTGTPSLSTNVPTPRSSNGSDTISNILDSYCPYAEPPIAWKFVIQRKPSDVDQDLLHQWCEVFRLLPNLETVHIACNGDPAWLGCTDIESALIMLRITLERVNPKHIHTVCLSPIHVMGIMHLRWAGAGAYGEACASRDPVWYRLKALKLRILSPYTEGRLSKSQTQLFEKIFADYLRSFSRTLTKLELSWLGEAGPNPFNVGQDHQTMKPTNTWNRLEELRLINVIMHCSSSHIQQLAPNIRKLTIAGGTTSGDQVVRKHWKGCQGQESEGPDNGNASWMSSRDVRLSAIPEPLFQHHLA